MSNIQTFPIKCFDFASDYNFSLLMTYSQSALPGQPASSGQAAQDFSITKYMNARLAGLD